jgi:hypothetical protein
MRLKLISFSLVLSYFLGLSGCIAINKHRYTKGFHISTHGKASLIEKNIVSRKPENTVNVIENQELELTVSRTKKTNPSPKPQTALGQYVESKSVRPLLHTERKSTLSKSNSKANRLLAKVTNSKQNTLSFTAQENPKEDILYILALVALVLLILVLLKNFPLLSLLLFIIALLIVLRYFDLI